MTYGKAYDEPEIPVISGDGVTPLPPPPAQAQVATAIPPPEPDLVEMVAPMDLQEGYQLTVDVNGQNRVVSIPPGGVKQGQTFQARPFLPAASSMTTTTATTSSPYMSTISAAGGKPAEAHYIPSGQWRDGLCDCCTLGCCHAMCCLGFWFEPILVGQVMTRMSRDCCGGRGRPPSTSNTCKIITVIFIAVFCAEAVLNIIRNQQTCDGGRLQFNFETGENEILCPDGSVEEPTDTYNILRGIGGLVSFVFGIYILVLTCRTRQVIRRKYNIPAGCCGEGCEDCCCAFWCSCCTVQQMARHTNDYHTYDVECCSNDCCNKRGQQEHLPEIEV